MSEFGWSYPAGCSGTPYDEFSPEEDRCVTCHGALPEDAPEGSPQEEGFCCVRCRDEQKDIIRTITDLGVKLYDRKESDKVDAIVSGVSRSLFKYTNCGVWFHYTAPMNESYGTVSVTGYCEGVDAECPPHMLSFPFWPEAWWQAVEEADGDGGDLWNETHGCEDCGPEEANGYRRVNPDCKKCGGEGEVI